ncbi:hypothetical protein Taro_029352 [Colocasia esculenta]|uniref:Uncharacterized protein n=1 Tax=Colocasia esculenta TaxID=4460 RepID=A0A843VIQ8_COLES|nr:hypothetical protein [Colocasia esculenta]
MATTRCRWPSPLSSSSPLARRRWPPLPLPASLRGRRWPRLLLPPPPLPAPPTPAVLATGAAPSLRGRRWPRSAGLVVCPSASAIRGMRLQWQGSKGGHGPPTRVGLQTAREMSGAVFSSDPVIARKNLQWLEAIMLDDKDWLDDATAKDLQKEISNWAYDAEDALDDWRFERLRAEAENPPAQGAGGRNARGTVAHLHMDPSFRDRVNALLRKRRALWETYGQLPLEELQPLGINAEPLPPTSSSTEPKIHGREDDKEILVGFLLREEVEDKLSVVPVLGAAGVGKTTLLQHICDDEMVSHHFNLKTWVTASGGRQMIEVMKEIAESLTGGPCSATQLGVVQNLLMQKIEGLKYFLVLDDVRYETIDGGQWEKLRSTFSNCADGSVVILTTQEDRVAERMGTVPPYMLESLSGDLCCHTDMIALPNGISNMKHLRYLNLSGSKIETVDASVFNQLYNLQTLNLRSTQIRELPDTIGNLSNMLHLCLNDIKIAKLPESIAKYDVVPFPPLSGSTVLAAPFWI